ncbi:bifunctional Cyclin PHO80-like/Cyclin-like superfamily/Cyclin-like [Babesia duncani]|uniref:Bifunctional Cyclin PHO80-like/Cyclin-like superfamily/Cyclin-like n=1 Tax=Babesia duncani TaxID=323732 RepID=A0AAD9UQN9_9APIC|nr:bifunctional Cyclin PHO80-like/Cyclin-like superfamily/Cyclin-like [Babesia duncani]
MYMKSVEWEEPVAKPTDEGFIKLLANVLTKIVQENRDNKGVVTRFHSLGIPPISIADYIVRIAKHVRCSNECFVLAFVYIDRILKLHSEFCLSALNVHRFVITAVMLAAKFTDDVYYSNKFYALVGGVKVAEINLLESQFLILINYQLYVRTCDYEACRIGLGQVNVIMEPSFTSQQHLMYTQRNRNMSMSTMASMGSMAAMSSMVARSNYQQGLARCAKSHSSEPLSEWTRSHVPIFKDHMQRVQYKERLHQRDRRNGRYDCEAFVDALESRWHGNFKRKCSLRACNFACQPPLFHNNNIICNFNKKEAAW